MFLIWPAHAASARREKGEAVAVQIRSKLPSLIKLGFGEPGDRIGRPEQKMLDQKLMGSRR
jgi:hypothetical protein